MCIFSRKVDEVSKTNIYGRTTSDGVQYLVYQMQFSADAEVAMILPFPADRTKDEPEFINLERCKFFDKIARAFYEPVMRGGGMMKGRRTRSASRTLQVHKVGAFWGSFVPTIDDFDRLDERFRFADGTLGAMRELYSDFSFAVFKLKPGTNQKVHPMAFRFHTAQPDRVFYPTVHVHDGKVHSHERFDHSIYIQIPADRTEREMDAARKDGTSKPSDERLTQRLSIEDSQGILSDDYGFRMKLKGNYQNQDILFTF